MTDATANPCADASGAADQLPAGNAGLSRRNLLGGAAGLGVGVPLLAACGGGSDAGADSSGPIKKSDIPVGGGVVYDDRKVVVTQPEAGTYKAFSATCTHQGCLVGKVADGTIDCPCHGSRFSITDGSVVHGPASRPLPSVSFTVKGSEIVPS